MCSGTFSKRKPKAPEPSKTITAGQRIQGCDGNRHQKFSKHQNPMIHSHVATGTYHISGGKYCLYTFSRQTFCTLDRRESALSEGHRLYNDTSIATMTLSQVLKILTHPTIHHVSIL